MTEPRPIPRLERVALVVLVLGGAAVRIMHGLEMRASPMFEADQPPWDAFFYAQAAEAVAAGDLTGGRNGAYISSPPYLYFLGLSFWLFGRDVLAPRIAQAIFGALMPLALFGIGRRIYGRLAGWLAAVLGTGYGLFVFYDGELMKTSLGVTVATTALYLLVRAGPRTHNLTFVGTGLLLGVVALIRSNLLPFVPVAVLWAAWARRDARPWRAAAAAALGAAVLLVPFHTRHQWLPADDVPFASGTGIHFYIGNRVGANGTYARTRGIRPNALGHVQDAKRLAEEATGRSMTAPEVSQWWLSRGLDEVSRNPSRWLALFGRKLWFLVNGYEIPSNEDVHYSARYSRVLRWPLFGFGLIAPFALLGIVATTRRAGPRAWLVVIYAAVAALSLVPLWITARYRLPLVPALLVFAGAAGAWIAQRVRAKEWNVLTWGGVGLAAAAIVVNVPTPIHPRRFMAAAEQKVNRIERLERSRAENPGRAENQGRPSHARKRTAEPETARPFPPPAGKTSFTIPPSQIFDVPAPNRAGRGSDGIEPRRQRAVETQPNRKPRRGKGPVPRFTAVAPALAEARLRIASGENDAALDALHQALKMKPDSAGALRLMARVWRQKGELDRAIEALERIDLPPNSAAAALIERELGRLRAELAR